MSSPINNMAFVAIKMGRRQGGCGTPEPREKAVRPPAAAGPLPERGFAFSLTSTRLGSCRYLWDRTQKKKPAFVKTKAGFKLCWRNVKQRVRYLAFWRR